MNKYFPPKPLAKDLSVVKKTVRKGAVWSQARSAVQCSSSRGTPRRVARCSHRTIVRGNQQIFKKFCFCLTNVTCNCCVLVVGIALVTTGVAELARPYFWDSPLKYIFD